MAVLNNRNSMFMGIMGPLWPVLIPRSLNFTNPGELGRALAAWRYDLSRDEIHLLEFVAQGLTNSQIAEQTGVAEENTVKNRLKVVFKKLGVNNRAQAATIPAIYGFAGKWPSPPHSKE